MIAFPTNQKNKGGPADTFAFNFVLDFANNAQGKRGSMAGLVNGWDLYDPMKELERIGLINGPHSR
jgi:hypothetical protein